MEKLTTEWQLDKYFYSSINDENIEKDFNVFKSKADVFIEKYKKTPIYFLSPDDLLIFLEEDDSLTKEVDKIFNFLHLTHSLDTQNQDVKKVISKYEKACSDYSEKLLFINEQYKRIGYDGLMNLSNEEQFYPFKNSLIRTANELKYMLSEEQEQVYLKIDSANDSSLRGEFVTSFDFEYKGKKITEDEARVLRESPDREVRKEAYELLSNVYHTKQNQIVLGNLYSTVCKKNVANMELRKFDTVMSSRNLSEEVSDEAVNTLLKNNSYELYQRFLKIKSKILNLDKMEIYDTFAPLVTERKDVFFSFEDGWKLYTETITSVDPALLDFSNDMLNTGRISVYPKIGKSSGAYAMYSTFLPAFVLLNWSDTKGDTTTLAHELGHAFHGYLAKKQKNCVYHPPLTLAETASIFNETLMFETLVDLIEDKEEKRNLICERLSDMFGTISRQIAYTAFEKRCHDSFANNEPLTYVDFNKIWLEETQKLYGPDVNIDSKLSEYAWSSVPHIFETPFYCYTYAFGNIISLNLYQNYKHSENKEEFIKKYHEFLAAASSDTPENLLNKIFSIKFDDTFYKVAYENIENLISKLEE